MDFQEKVKAKQEIIKEIIKLSKYKIILSLQLPKGLKSKC